MKIEEIRIDIIESESIEPEWRPLRQMMEYPGSYRARFAHRPYEGETLRLEARAGLRGGPATAHRLKPGDLRTPER